MAEPDVMSDDNYTTYGSRTTSPIPIPAPTKARERERVQRRRPPGASASAGAAPSNVRRKLPRDALTERIRGEAEYESMSDGYGMRPPPRRDPGVVAQERARAWQAAKAGTALVANENDARRDLWDAGQGSGSAEGGSGSGRRRHRGAGHRKPVRDYTFESEREEAEQGSRQGTGRSSRKAKSTREARGASPSLEGREEDLAELYRRMQDHMGWSES